MTQKLFKNVLICGGSGFIGSNFVRHFFNKYHNYKIFNLDLLTYAGNSDNLKDIEKEQRYHFIRGDICSESLLREIFSKNKFDLVVNFAAESHVDRSIVSVTDFLRTNIEGVRSLLDIVRVYKVPRFVQISTDEVYGDISLGSFADEDSAFRPSNPYSSSKAGAELLIHSFIRTHNVPAIVIRGSNNFGPFQYPEKLIPLAITNILENKKIPIHGDGLHVRSWLHVDDFCEAIDLIAHSAADHSVYNVSGEEKKNIEVIKIIADYLGKDLHAFREHVKDRPGADLRYASVSRKLEKDLGWKRQYSFEKEISNVIDWYCKNTEWWKNIKEKKEYLHHYEKQSKGNYY